MININQESVKKLLLKLQPSDTDFTVIFSGKKSGKVNGLYKQELNEIVIHNKNFQNDNQLIYTAIHEYSHHLMWCKYHKIGKVPKHNNEFWRIMYNLIDLAEEKKLYKKYPDESIKKEIQNLVSSAKMKINKTKNTMTIRYDSSMPSSFPEFVLLVKEFSYGKEYYPIQEIYFDDQGIIGNVELVQIGYSFIMGSKKQKQSAAHCRLMIEHINRKKISFK